MRFTLGFAAFAAMTGLATSEIVVNYDEALEGQFDTYEEVVEVPGKISEQASIMTRGPLDGDGSKVEAAKRGTELSPRQALNALLGRQYYCNPGYGYCSGLGGCCPDSNRCCSYGYCLQPGKTCCPSGPCGVGKTCCGRSHCMPPDASCCGDESYCPRGNQCYLVSGVSGSVCCTNRRCTARVGVNGLTTTAPRRTRTTTYSTRRTYTQYYYWTLTWYYYYYYWTYSAYITASVVTSSRRSTSSTFSVYTTAAADASSYFSSVSSTLSLPTPASATTLASIAGKTSYVGPNPTADIPPNDSEPSESASSTQGPPRSGGDSGSSGSSGSSGGDKASSAGRLWVRVDAGFAAFVATGAVIGIIAVAL